MKTLTATLYFIVLSTTLWAHDGHDHDGPSSFQPKKGGVVKSTEDINIETITQKDRVNIYLFDNDGKKKTQDSFEINAQIQLPKQNKKETVKLKTILEEGKFCHFELEGHPKKVHRYTLHLTVKDKKENHTDKLSFTIEPTK
ncbi:MAG: hypothetical protein JNL11_04450 [Bdellovibrionaceae bacterium]|nr:hypothetical protein [Pseudobdellovibrionaceae bacterium]